jgi:hypothetical protein
MRRPLFSSQGNMYSTWSKNVLNFVHITTGPLISADGER